MKTSKREKHGWQKIVTTIPRNAILVSQWDNWSSNCIGPTNHDYIHRCLFYSPSLDEFKIITNSYNLNYSYRTLSISDDIEINNSWTTHDKDLLKKYKEIQ